MPTPLETVIAAARDLLGERLTTNATLREHHSHGQDTQPPHLPDAVAFVETTEEVARLLALCHAHGVPVVPWGAGTSLEGHVTPVRGGITLDLSRMTAHPGGQPGGHGLPGGGRASRASSSTRICATPGCSSRSIPAPRPAPSGGMCATRASGTNAVRYGTIRENVLGLTVVAGRRAGDPHRRAGAQVRHRLRPDPAVHRLGGHARRDHRDPACACTASRRRCPRPPASSTTLRDAVETVITILQIGIPVARIELLDEVQMAACIAYSKLDGAGSRCRRLFFEFHGTAGRGRRAGAAGGGDRERLRRPRLPLGDRRRPSAASCGRRATTRCGPALALKPGHQGHRRRTAIVPISRAGRGDPGGEGGHRRLRA